MKKAIGPDKIPPKIVKLAANIIDSQICNEIRVSHLQRFLNKPKLLILDRYTKNTKGKKLKTTDRSQFYDLSQKSVKSFFKSL